MSISRRLRIGLRQDGLSLIELVMFIVIVGIGVAGILLVMDITTRSSADPMIRKQSLAIAESLLEEIELMPFTYCDPDDANAANATASTAAQCPAAGGIGGPEGMGPETDGQGGEIRYFTLGTPQFDNVNDYHGFEMKKASGGIKDVSGTVVSTALDDYTATVAVVAADLGGITAASGDALQITVTVTGPDSVPVSLTGYRVRYSPTVVP
ncbi:MAG TPA: type II secretion system protein [Paucimonas sp.]|nr:type II secretion system protein [Paucimonas sp.]